VIKLADGRQSTLREAASNSSVTGPQVLPLQRPKYRRNNKRCACLGVEKLCNIVNVTAVKLVNY